MRYSVNTYERACCLLSLKYICKSYAPSTPDTYRVALSISFASSSICLRMENNKISRTCRTLMQFVLCNLCFFPYSSLLFFYVFLFTFFFLFFSYFFFLFLPSIVVAASLSPRGRWSLYYCSCPRST